MRIEKSKVKESEAREFSVGTTKVNWPVIGIREEYTFVPIPKISKTIRSVLSKTMSVMNMITIKIRPAS